MTLAGDTSDIFYTVQVAVVGAGMAGSTAARVLKDNRCGVQVFEKSRGVGGRLATRREPPYAFDHGAQYFTTRNDLFRRYVQAWEEMGAVGLWRPRLFVVDEGSVWPLADREQRYVGVPSMNSMVKALVSNIDVELESRVVGVAREDEEWYLAMESGVRRGPFDAVVLAVPADQAAPLLACAPPLQERALSARMQPCWSAMFVFDHDIDVPYDAAFVHDGPIGWVARNASKPGRADGECWVVHATHAWSRENLELGAESVAQILLDAFLATTRMKNARCTWKKAHRWRFSSTDRPLADGCLWDSDLRIGACGDWCHSARVEGAFLSGWRLAEKVISGFEADRLIRRA